MTVSEQRRRLLLSCAVATLSAPSLRAQPAPRPLHVLVSFPPGGASDQLARAFSNKLNQRFGYAAVVDNRPGGGSQIAVSVLKQAPADGATVFVGDIGAFSLNEHLYPRLNYSVAHDLAPVALLAKAPLFLVVPISSPARSLADLLALGRRPEGLTYASPGVGTGAHLVAEMFARSTGLRLVHAPYRGAGPALIDVASGHVDLIFDPLVSSGPLLKDGRTRALAIAAPQRSPSLAEVPTLREGGVEGVNFVAWWGLAARAGTPAAEIQRLHADVAQAMADKDVARTFTELGMNVDPISVEAFRALIAEDSAGYGGIIKDLALKLE